VLEPAESILHGIMAATETANTLLRCDQVISARGD
jgi:chaperonin GroEL (HSP60 family)